MKTWNICVIRLRSIGNINSKNVANLTASVRLRKVDSRNFSKKQTSCSSNLFFGNDGNCYCEKNASKKTHIKRHLFADLKYFYIHILNEFWTKKWFCEWHFFYFCFFYFSYGFSITYSKFIKIKYIRNVWKPNKEINWITTQTKYREEVYY